MGTEELKKHLNLRMNGHVLAFDGKNLTINSTGTPKNIGWIAEENGKVILRKLEKEADIYRAFNAWTINAQVIECVDIIRYKSDVRTYEIEAGKAMLLGIDLKGKSKVESKIAVPLEYWTIINSEDEKEKKRIERMGTEWYSLLKKDIESEYFTGILSFLAERKRLGAIVYPETADLFSAFRECPFSKTRVVIMGNEPVKRGVADGLAFSTNLPFYDTLEISRIQDELERSIPNYERVFNPHLWADQGCLMLNQILTTEETFVNGEVSKIAVTHEGRGWEKLTGRVIELLNHKERRIIFVFIGSRTHEYVKLVKQPHSYIVANVQYDTFIGSDVFNKVNEILNIYGEEPIEW